MTKKIPVSELCTLLRYEPETGKLYWRPRPGATGHEKTWNTRYAGTEAFTAVMAKGYLCGNVRRSLHYAHRVIWAMEHGEWPTQIDHINGVKTDNRIENLREVSPTENSRNLGRSKRSNSGVMGVCWDKHRKKWAAQIVVANRTVHLGRFDRIEDAVTARKAAEAQHDFHPNHGRASPVTTQ